MTRGKARYLVTRDRPYSDNVQSRSGVEQLRAVSLEQVPGVVGAPHEVRLAIDCASEVPRRHDDEHLMPAGELIQCRGEATHVAAVVRLAQVAEREVEHLRTVVVDEVGDGVGDVVLDEPRLVLRVRVGDPS